jgi:hypothetical protein
VKLSWIESSSAESVSATSSSTEMDSCSSEEGSAQLEKCGPLPSGSGAALIDARPLAIADWLGERNGSEEPSVSRKSHCCVGAG